MFKNYVKVTLRNLRKHKGYSFINITGLAIGLTSCFLIFLYIQFELSFENFHANKDRIYRVLVETSNDGTASKHTLTPPAFAVDWSDRFPEIEKAARYSPSGEPLLTLDNDPLPKKTFAYADSSFFEIFSFRFIAGDPDNALNAPMSLVITREIAQNYFPGENPLGKTVQLMNEYEFTITGVLDNVPPNTHLKFGYLASINSIPVVQRELYPEASVPDLLNNYLTWNFNTYLLLRGSDPDVLENKINEYNQTRGDGDYPRIDLQALNDIHFSRGIGFDTASGNLQYVYIFSTIAILVLAIAGFNFINLSTARAIKRAREVGLRKVLGAERRWLVIQFLGEAVVFVTLAFVLSLFLLELVFPYFQPFIGTGVSSPFSGNPGVIAVLAVITLVTGLLAGSYPAFHLSSFKPIQALKQKISGQNTSVLRKGLTIFQFAVAAFLLIGTFFIYSQMQFMKNSDPGFQKEQVVYFSLSDLSTEQQSQFEAFRQELLNHSAVKGVSRTSEVPGKVSSSYTYQYIDQGTQKELGINTILVDRHFIDLLEIKIKEGQNFHSDNIRDLQNDYIINEATVQKLGLEEPIGAAFRNKFQDSEFGEIIGVVEDFQYAGLQNKIEPLVLDLTQNYRSTGIVKLGAGNLEQGIHALNTVWEKFYPGYPLQSNFLDETFDQLYRYESNLGKLLAGFSGLAIFVACLGLIGLSSFMAEQRKKEIGIRKVLGASVTQIVSLLNRDFMIPVVIGILIAIPLSWIVMSRWLQNFAHHIEMNAGFFVLAGLVLLAVSVVTVSYHALSAAVVNPAQSLKTE